jgi:PEP-CTERM motif
VFIGLVYWASNLGEERRMNASRLATSLLVVLACWVAPAWAGSLVTFNMPLTFEIAAGSSRIVGDQPNDRPYEVLTGRVGSYQVTATLCMDGWCGGSGVNGTVDTPAMLRLTQVTATCMLASGTCGLLEFSYDWAAEAPRAPGYGGMFQPFSVALNGSSDAGFTGSLRAFAQGQAGVTTTIALSFGPGAFSLTQPLGSIFINDGQGSFGIGGSLDISGVAAGTSFRLPSSLEMLVGTPVTAVPEPGALSLLVAGLGIVGWAGRRRSAGV